MSAEKASPVIFPESRDTSRTEARHGVFERLRRRFHRDTDIGGVPFVQSPDRLVADQAVEDSEERDEQYFENIRDRDHDAIVAPKLEATFDEQHRLETMNREYLDHMTEKYAHSVLDTEESHEKTKYGEGRLGRARQFMADTYLGRSLKIGVKGALAVTGAVVGGPLGIYAAKKLGTDAALEAIQFYGYEAPVMQRLRAMKAQRINLIGRLQEARNTQFPDDKAVPITGALKAELEAIINRVDPAQPDLELADPTQLGIEQVDTEINRLEQRIAVIRQWGQAIRSLAGIGWSLQTIHEFIRHGLSFGWQNFDGDKTKHIVKMTKDIFTHGSDGFAYLKGMAMDSHGVFLEANGLRPPFLTSLGTVAPYAKLWGTAAGLAAGLVGSTVHEVNSFIHQRRVAQNPKEAPVMSFRGRTQHGNAGKEFAPLIRPQDQIVAQTDKEKAAEIKGSIASGNLIEMIVPATWATIPSFPPAGSKIIIEIEEITDDVVKYHLIDPATSEPIKDPVNGTIKHWRQERAGDAFFLGLKKISDNLDSYKELNRKAPWEALKKKAETKGQIAPTENHDWRADTAVALRNANGTAVGYSLAPNDQIIIKSITETPVPVGLVWVRNTTSAHPVYKGTVMLEDIVDHGHDEGVAGASVEDDADYSVFKSEIEHKLGRPLRGYEKWNIDGNWYAIMDVTDSYVTYTSDAMPAVGSGAALPADKLMRENYSPTSEKLDRFWNVVIKPAGLLMHLGPLQKK